MGEVIPFPKKYNGSVPQKHSKSYKEHTYLPLENFYEFHLTSDTGPIVLEGSEFVFLELVDMIIHEIVKAHEKQRL